MAVIGKRTDSDVVSLLNLVELKKIIRKIKGFIILFCSAEVRISIRYLFYFNNNYTYMQNTTVDFSNVVLS